MFPTADVPNGGNFVEHRIAAMRTLGVEVDPWAMGNVPSPQSAPSEWRYVNGLSRRMLLLNRLAPGTLGLSDAARRIQQQARGPFDLVVAHGMYLPPAGALARKLSRDLRIPYVIQAHGSDINVVMPKYPRTFQRVLRGAGAVLYVSEALRAAAVSRGAPEGNSHVVPNGVDHRIFYPPTGSVPRTSVTFVGSLLPVKGADRLSEIFARIRSRVDVDFTVVGDGPLRDRLEREFAELGLTVKLTGNLSQNEVAEVMRRSRVVVLPSRSEGWPCTVLEGQACGAVVVGTDVGGVAEAIGDAGLVVPAKTNTAAALADLIVRVFNAPDDDAAAVRAPSICRGRS